MATTTKFFKIGLSASSFYDTATGLQISKTKPGSLPQDKYLRSDKVKTASARGHIIEIKEDEYNALLEGHNQTNEAGKEASLRELKGSVNKLVSTFGAALVLSALTDAAPELNLSLPSQVTQEEEKEEADEESIEDQISRVDDMTSDEMDALALALGMSKKERKALPEDLVEKADALVEYHKNKS
jgi:hypothetical protein